MLSSKTLFDSDPKRLEEVSPKFLTVQNSGFSLIELLVVVTIIAILTFAFFNVARETRRNSLDSRRKGDLTQVKVALAQYFEINRSYPESDGNGKMKCPSGSGLTWGQDALACGGQTYMRQLPKDPGRFQYCYDATPISAPTTYSLRAYMEKSNNANINPAVVDPATCTGTYNFILQDE